MVCLDTDIIIDFLKEKNYAVKKIKELQVNNQLSTTSLNTFELFKLPLKARNVKASESLNDLLSYLRIYDFNFESSEKAAEIFQSLKSKGELLDIADIMIASIAIINNESLLTRNLKHFKRISGLRLESC